MSWFSRLLRSAQRSRLNGDLEDEQQFHIESRVDDLMREGMTRDQAEHEACRHFGNRMLLREASRDVKLLPWLESIYQDVEFGLRM